MLGFFDCMFLTVMFN